MKREKDGKIFVISAPSGTGKSTIVNQLMKEIPCFERSISYTTRSPRDEEVDKKDYFFISPLEFKKKIKKNFFVEWAIYRKNYYGTSYSYINNTIERGKNLLLVIDTQGALQIRKKYPHNSILIFLLPPSMKELERRLRKRGTELEKDLVLRLQIAKKEIQKIKYYDYVVINDKIEAAINKIKTIIVKHG